jgi:hypothetical protein
MYSWLESEILGMSGGDYIALYGVLCAVCLYLLYYCYRAYRRFRFVDGTATSKIRSAAQGLVELKGLAEWLPGDSIASPFSNARCVWYHCTIDRRERRGKRTSWTNISDECSDQLFRLVDETGSCIISPEHAHVIPESDVTWYGGSTEHRNRPPARAGWIRFGTGKYRFRERLIRPATTLYALGWFRTLHNNPSDEYIGKQVEDLVRQWKLQPQRYLTDFDFDRNGKIQQSEWKAVRSAARRQVLAKINAENSEQHLLSRAEDKGLPFILSATPEEELVVRKKYGAYASVSAAFLIFVGLVVMFSVRAPIPV